MLHVLDKIMSNYLRKFLQDRIKPQRVGALRLSTGIHFFVRNVLMKIL